MKKIAFYGKGGIGKSTTAANVAAALSLQGRQVCQIGCDPKNDSTRLLLGHICRETVLDKVRTSVALQLLDKLKAVPPVDVTLYDVLGDVVCGGFAMPIREGYAEEIYIISSGELMSLYAANNIAKGIRRFASRGSVRLAGIIGNSRNTPGEKELLKAFAEKLNTRLVAFVPRDRIVNVAENRRQTVLQFAPDCGQATVYKELAETIWNNTELTIPTPLAFEELEELAAQFGSEI